MKRFPLFLVMVPVLSMVAFSGCREAKFESAWNERAITIDGQYSEWTAPLRYFDQPSMYMGFRNDRDNLYILVKTVDRRAQVKVLRLGLTVWFDPPDSKGKAWGVHYPLGMKNPGIRVVGRDTPGDLTEEQRREVTEMLGGMEVREAGEGKRIRISARDADSSGYGIRVAVRDTPEVVVYELKVPLRGDGVTPFSVTPDKNGRIRLRFETGDMRPEKWSSIREDSLRVVDPMGNASSGRIWNKSRVDRGGKPRLSAPPNPLTEPIRFEAVVSLAKEPGIPDNARK